MKIENQVCTLKQAVKLKGLGVKQDSHFFWVDRKEKSKLVYAKSVEFLNSLPIYSAYSVSELGQMLPDEYLRHDIEKENYFGFGRGIWKINDNDWGERKDYGNHCNFHKTESTARASLLIWLIENKIVSVETCIKRLTE